VLWLLLAFSSIGSAAPTTLAQEPQTLEVFTRPGCIHCARARDYLDDLRTRRPNLAIIEQDVSADPQARERLRDIAARHGVAMAVPTFVVGDHVLVGFDDATTTGRTIEGWLDERQADLDTIDLPLFGQIHVRDLGLPLFSIVLGLVDGFNPCAMWVLLFLLSLLVNLRSRRRMALIGGTFMFVSGAAYYLFMTAWLGMFLVVGVSRWLEAALGLVAIAAGSIHVKDFVAPHHGPSLSIPERAKPKIYDRIRRIVYAENLTGALATTIALAVTVNLVELLCTAGLPALFTQVLSAHGLSWWQHHAYMLLYVTAYMLDDAAMLAIALVTLSRRKLQERAGRAMKLLSGAVMIALGLLLLFRPGWLRFG
jgi:cytochrome c biogenesis protein CcdA/glutaredoxin